MRKILIALIVGLSLMASIALAGTKNTGPAPNGMIIPEDWKDWRLISVAQRNDKNSLRAILGNNIAIDAARAGKTNPWPEGTIIAKIFWKQKTSELYKDATVPAELVHVDFIQKDSQKYASTGGWGWVRRFGLEQKDYDKPNFGLDCMGCHPKEQDYVFTRPPQLP